MYKVWIINCFKEYPKSSSYKQNVGFIMCVCVIMGTEMATAYDFTNVYFLCSTTEWKFLITESWNWGVREGIIHHYIHLLSSWN
jgi:hypothetical protein